MQLIIKGKGIEVSDSLREYVEKKIGTLDRYLPDLDEARVELSAQSARNSSHRQVVQVTMRNNGTILRAEQRDSDMFAAIDGVRDKLQRQIKRFKERSVRVKARAQAAALEQELLPEEEVFPRIVRTKRFTASAMTPEEAIEQMELLGHDFFVFYNLTESALNVLYRRRDGNYGLLQPEFT